MLAEPKSQGPLDKFREIADFVFATIQKITSQAIRISGTLVFLCTGATICLNF